MVVVAAPSALQWPPLAKFVERGFAAVNGTGFGLDVLVALWKELCENKNFALLVDIEGAKLLGFMVLDGYCGPLRTYGWIVHNYIERSDAKRRLTAAAADWFRKRGVYRVRAANGTRAPNDVFIRAVAGRAFPARVVTSIIEFDLEENRHEREQQELEHPGHHAQGHRAVP